MTRHRINNPYGYSVPVECGQSVRDAAPDMFEALIAALPYVETAEADPAYKPGAVARITKQIRSALSKAKGE